MEILSESIDSSIGDPEDGVSRREEILDAATDLFAEFGYSEAVTKDLAEKLQVGKGTIYRYFSSKRELFLATVDRVMRRMRVQVDRAVADIPDPLERRGRRHSRLPPIL